MTTHNQFITMKLLVKNLALLLLASITLGACQHEDDDLAFVDNNEQGVAQNNQNQQDNKLSVTKNVLLNFKIGANDIKTRSFDHEIAEDGMMKGMFDTTQKTIKLWTIFKQKNSDIHTCKKIEWTIVDEKTIELKDYKVGIEVPETQADDFEAFANNWYVRVVMANEDAPNALGQKMSFDPETAVLKVETPSEKGGVDEQTHEAYDKIVLNAFDYDESLHQEGKKNRLSTVPYIYLTQWMKIGEFSKSIENDEEVLRANIHVSNAWKKNLTGQGTIWNIRIKDNDPKENSMFEKSEFNEMLDRVKIEHPEKYQMWVSWCGGDEKYTREHLDEEFDYMLTRKTMFQGEPLRSPYISWTNDIEDFYIAVRSADVNVSYPLIAADFPAAQMNGIEKVEGKNGDKEIRIYPQHLKDIKENTILLYTHASEEGIAIKYRTKSTMHLDVEKFRKAYPVSHIPFTRYRCELLWKNEDISDRNMNQKANFRYWTNVKTCATGESEPYKQLFFSGYDGKTTLYDFDHRLQPETKDGSGRINRVILPIKYLHGLDAGYSYSTEEVIIKKK